MNGRKLATIALIVLIALVPLAVLPAMGLVITGQKVLGWIATAGAAVGMALAVKDADTGLTKTTALPNGAATTTSAGIDLGIGAKGDCGGNFELMIEAPALATTPLPDTKTMTYDVYHDTASDFSGEVLLMGSVIVQTGAGGAGAAAATKSVRMPVDVNRYIRVKATNSGAGDASGSNFVAGLRF